MPFPFIPFGAMTAAVVLGGTFALFYWLAIRLDRAVTDVGGAVVGKLVSGFDDWSHERRRPPVTTISIPSGSVHERAEPIPTGADPARRR